MGRAGGRFDSASEPDSEAVSVSVLASDEREGFFLSPSIALEVAILGDGRLFVVSGL